MAVAPTIRRFKAGDRVADTYLVKRLLGEGGMSTVYLVRQKRWDIDLALKVPQPGVLADPENRHRITREAEAWTRLGLHPHIAYCCYVHPLDGVPLLAVEYVDGGNLGDWTAEGRCAVLKDGLDLAIQFCRGLEHADSRGMIHRDIKHENILLTSEGVLKITDFGIARFEAPGECKSTSVRARLTRQGTAG
jgi:serine/threonine protein kinase